MLRRGIALVVVACATHVAGASAQDTPASAETAPPADAQPTFVQAGEPLYTAAGQPVCVQPAQLAYTQQGQPICVQSGEPIQSAAPTSSQQATRPIVSSPEDNRHGFTLTFGLGAGLFTVPKEDFTEAGLYGLTLTAGAFLNPRVAIAARCSEGWVFLPGGDGLVIASLLASIEFWATNLAVIGGGIGVCALGGLSGPTRFKNDLGLAVSVRVGLNFAEWSGGALRAVLEFLPGIVEGELIAMTALGIEYQYF